MSTPEPPAHSSFYGGSTPPRAPGVAEPAVKLHRNFGFSGVIGSTVGAMLYPLLPQSVRTSLPLHEFVLVMGAAAAFCQRAVVGLWNALLGEVAKEARDAFLIYIRLRRIRYYLRIGSISAEDADALTTELVETNLRKGIGA